MLQIIPKPSETPLTIHLQNDATNIKTNNRQIETLSDLAHNLESVA